MSYEGYQMKPYEHLERAERLLIKFEEEHPDGTGAWVVSPPPVLALIDVHIRLAQAKMTGARRA